MKLFKIKLLLIALLSFATVCSAANDFSGDSSWQAGYSLENGALTTDSSGNSNTLTDGNGVTADAVNYKEGAASADLENDSSQYLYIDDADLSANFPLKVGDTTKKITICFWFKGEVTGISDTLIGKWDSTGDKKSFIIYIKTGDTISLGLGYNSGADTEIIDHLSATTDGQWYHVGVTYDDSDKSYRIRIWDDNAGTILGTDKTGTATLDANKISVESSSFTIGATAGLNLYYDGLIDEVEIFNDIKTPLQIDQIRNATYPRIATYQQHRRR